jgi:hypothetical protein
MNEVDTRRAALLAREGKQPGLRGKINAMCIYCIYDPIGGGGNWRQQVGACTGKECPLYSVRPQSKPKA